MSTDETPAPEDTLRAWLDLIRSEMLERSKVLPPVFSADGIPRVAVSLPKLRELHDIGRTALAHLAVQLAGLQPGEHAVLALHVREADLPEVAVRSTVQAVQQGLQTAGWDPLPQVLAFGPQMELRWLTDEQRVWLQLKQQAEIDNAAAVASTLREVVDRLYVAASEARGQLGGDQQDLRASLAQSLNYATEQLEEMEEL